MIVASVQKNLHPVKAGAVIYNVAAENPPRVACQLLYVAQYALCSCQRIVYWFHS